LVLEAGDTRTLFPAAPEVRVLGIKKAGINPASSQINYLILK